MNALTARTPPGERAFSRAVGGATPSGRVLERARVRLAGLRRAEPEQILIYFADERTEARVRVDGGALRTVRANRDGELIVSLPPRATPSATLELVATSAPLRVLSMTVTAPSSPWPPILALILVALTIAALLDRAELEIVFAVGLAVAAMVALGFATTRFWLPLVFVVSSALIGRRSRFYWATSGLAAQTEPSPWARRAHPRATTRRATTGWRSPPKAVVGTRFGRHGSPLRRAYRRR